jgi:hypothetical protein
MNEKVYICQLTVLAKTIKKYLVQQKIIEAKGVFLRSVARGFDPFELVYLIGHRRVLLK